MSTTAYNLTQMIDNTKWLKVRAQVYNKYTTLPKHPEPLGLRIDPADAGWIDMDFTASGSEYKITLSEFPEPFVGIRQWLEDIIVQIDRLDFTLDVDCDTAYNTIFHFEHLTSYDDYVGLFYIYDSDEDNCLSAYVNLYEFIRLIYTRILNYALEGEKTEEFRQNWLEYISEDDYPDGLLSSVFRSEIIETFLKLKHRHKTYWHFTKE